MDFSTPGLTHSPLAIGGSPWRAGRVAATVAAFAEGAVAPDTALEHLAEVGSPEAGWLETLTAIRRAGGCVLRLPRSGDPRGVALPRGVTADAAVGWRGSDGASVWLVPGPGQAWQQFDLETAALRQADPAVADQLLRVEIVRAAHVVDHLAQRPKALPGRVSIEEIADSWILGPPALPTGRRGLASASLRLLLALGAARGLPGDVDTAALERAARTAVESAFSSTSATG